MRCSSCSPGHLSCVSLLYSLWLVSGDGVSMDDLHCLYRVLFHLRCVFTSFSKMPVNTRSWTQTVFNCHPSLCVRVCVCVFCWICKSTPYLHKTQQLANGWGIYTRLFTCSPVCVFRGVRGCGWVSVSVCLLRIPCIIWIWYTCVCFSRCAIKSLTWLHNTF